LVEFLGQIIEEERDAWREREIQKSADGSSIVVS
jgi:hypothetical protein